MVVDAPFKMDYMDISIKSHLSCFPSIVLYFFLNEFVDEDPKRAMFPSLDFQTGQFSIMCQ